MMAVTTVELTLLPFRDAHVIVLQCIVVMFKYVVSVPDYVSKCDVISCGVLVDAGVGGANDASGAVQSRLPRGSC